MLGNKKKYDLVFSLGEACSCTSVLRANDMQFFSYPFDWLFGSSFMRRTDILSNKFDRFIDEQDLEFSYSERSISCDAYKNTYNGLVFNHDFPTGVELKKSYFEVRAKYARRIDRLLRQIDESKNILIVYIETPNSDDKLENNQVLIQSMEKINKAFPGKKIDLIYFSNLPNVKLKKNIITSNISLIHLDYKNKKENALDYEVNSKYLRKILNNYVLKQPFLLVLKRKFIRLCIKLIPISKIRKKLRGKYHV